ncbi:MAG: hypothetical protein EZS28_011789 [Streblomastix strix]|uniref:Uncharacterized protein n=1 Tax=Streblomastix strix TaxID=222440 RepID=A0A5J4WDD8_9EUKA|nr:MAG: hypothetical protein EZS28_011789 [Streblomastix strix]
MTYSTSDPKDGNIDINPTDIVHSQTRIHHFICVSFTSDGEKLIAETSSGDFKILIIITLMLESITLTCSNQIRSLLDTPSGQVLLIVSGSKDRCIICENLSVERRLSTFKTHSSIQGFRLIPDQKRVIIVHSDRSTVYFDLFMSDPIRIVNDARLRQFASNASTNDIDLFATGSVDHTVKLWNSDGKNLCEFRGHSGKPLYFTII